MSEHVTPLAPDYSLEEVSKAIGMSTRWVREQLKGEDAVEHLRYGHKIRFTAAQVEALRARHVKAPAPVDEPITTGRKKKTA